MPESVSINKKHHIIEVRSFGDVSFSDMGYSEAEVQRIRKERGFKRVLVDTSDMNKLPNVGEMFKLAAAFSTG